MAEWLKWQLEHSIYQNAAAGSLKLYIKSCLLATHLMAAHICFIAHSLYRSSFPLPNSTFSISVHRSPRQAPPPTQILCHPAATNCDASIYISTTHLSIAEHSDLTTDSPRAGSLQHISVHFSNLGSALRFNLRGGHPQICTCVDPTTRTYSPARAPHQRHDPHQQRVQNTRPRGCPRPPPPPPPPSSLTAFHKSLDLPAFAACSISLVIPST